jgi:hypothetical protein
MIRKYLWTKSLQQSLYIKNPPTAQLLLEQLNRSLPHMQYPIHNKPLIHILRHQTNQFLSQCSGSASKPQSITSMLDVPTVTLLPGPDYALRRKGQTPASPQTPTLPQMPAQVQISAQNVDILAGKLHETILANRLG